MMSTDFGPADAAAEFSPQRERELVHGTLLAATAALAAEQDPETALEQACEQFIQASPHLKAAWVYLLERTPERQVRGVYAAGSLPEGFRRAQSMEALFDALHLQGVGPLEQVVCFVFYGRDSLGCFGLRVARPDYFEQVGEAPFHLFANVAGSLIGQARLRTQLRERADHDELTGLLSRSAMQNILERHHARAERKGTPYALVLIDLDHFKLINDQLGHPAGDQVLIEAAARATGELRQSDWLGRWGGEEFLALLPDTEADEALDAAERVRRAFADKPFEFKGNGPLGVTLSGGVACFELDGVTLAALLGIADAALYEAKDAGRNRVQRATRRGRRLYTLAARLEQALREGRLRPAYQPIVDLNTGQVVGHEALARLVSRGRRTLPAAEFIEVATLRHLIHRIDEHIFRCTLEHCRECVLRGHSGMHFVNISAGLLRRPDCIASLAEVIREMQDVCGRSDTRDAHPLVIEITERDFIAPAQAREMLAPLLEQGVRLAIDDFGSGYSSFDYLVELPADFVKIEGSLVRRSADDPTALAVVRGICEIGKEAGLVILAEGVEDLATADRMRDLGVKLVQGFHFGHPKLERPPPGRLRM